jgi:hypothetical protein
MLILEPQATPVTIIVTLKSISKDKAETSSSATGGNTGVLERAELRRAAARCSLAERCCRAELKLAMMAVPVDYCAQSSCIAAHACFLTVALLPRSLHLAKLYGGRRLLDCDKAVFAVDSLGNALVEGQVKFC